MATSKEYLTFVLEQLTGLEEVFARPMMGEYVLYCQGKTVGGIYDDRLLLKPTKSVLKLMKDSACGVRMELPYPGAKELLLADVDDRELTCRAVLAAAEDLPAPKRRKKLP